MTEPRWLDAEEQQTWRTFLSAAILLFDQLDRELMRDAGLQQTYFEILVRLSEADGRALRMSVLARDSLSSRSRLSHAVSRLEEKGWVRREDCLTDRRGQVAVLTDAGFAVLQDAAPKHVESVRTHLFDQLDTGQQQALREVSEQIVKHFTDGPGPAAPHAGRT